MAETTSTSSKAGNGRMRPKLPIPTAEYWFFNAKYAEQYSIYQRMLFMENAVNHLESHLYVAVAQNIGDALRLWALSTPTGDAKP